MILDNVHVLRPLQLTLDGKEVNFPISPGTRRYPLGPAQKAVLRRLAYDSLTSTQAGVIVHGLRGHCGFGVKDHNAHSSYSGAGCCRYACADGLEVMKRLRNRGYADKIFGLWFAKPGFEEGSKIA